MTTVQHGIAQAIAGDGWGGLDVDPAQFSAQARKQAEKLAHDALENGISVLQTEAGRRLMVSLVRDVLMAPPSDAERQPADALWHAGRRTGQCEVVWMLLNAINALRALTGETET